MVTVNRPTKIARTSAAANKRNATKLRQSPLIRIKLAEESDTPNCDSDSPSLYDSMNGMETGL